MNRAEHQPFLLRTWSIASFAALALALAACLCIQHAYVLDLSGSQLLTRFDLFGMTLHERVDDPLLSDCASTSAPKPSFEFIVHRHLWWDRSGATPLSFGNRLAAQYVAIVHIVNYCGVDKATRCRLFDLIYQRGRNRQDVYDLQTLVGEGDLEKLQSSLRLLDAR